MSLRRKQILCVLVVFLVIVVADQVTKMIIMRVYPEPGLYRPAGGPVFFHFTHQRNPGLVGGMFSQTRAMALLAPLAAMAVLAYLFRYLDPKSKVQTVAFGLIAGGAIGNMIDRVRLGSVTDFLQFHFYFVPFDFPWKHYPAFNVADSCICTGVFLLMVSWLVTGNENAPNPV